MSRREFERKGGSYRETEGKGRWMEGWRKVEGMKAAV